MYSLAFLVSSVLIVEVGSVTVPLIPLVTLENPRPNYITPWFAGTNAARITHFRNNGWTKQLSNNNMGVMAPSMTAEAKSVCGENLVEVHEITDKNGQPALSTLSKDSIMAVPSLKYISLAGYLSKRPFACGASQNPLIELFSVVKNQSFYVTNPTQMDSFEVNSLEMYPTRVMGYMYFIGANPETTFQPWSTGFDGAYDTVHPVKRTSIIRMKHNNQQLIIVTSNERMKLLQTQGWSVVATPPGSLYSPEEGDCEGLKACGRMIKLVDVWDPQNNVAYVSPATEVPANHNVARVLGYCAGEYNGCGATMALTEHYNTAKKNQAFSWNSADAAALVKEGYAIKRAVCYVKSTNWEWITKPTQC